MILLTLLFIPTVAVWTTGSQCVLSDKVQRAACLTHRVIQPAHGRNKVVQPQLPHQGADAAVIFAVSLSSPNSVIRFRSKDLPNNPHIPIGIPMYFMFKPPPNITAVAETTHG